MMELFNMVREITECIKRELGDEADFSVTPAENVAFGHYATNAALKVAGKLGVAPREAAIDLAEKIKKTDQGRLFEKIEVAGPGFINFWLSKGAIQEAFRGIKKAGSKWGKGDNLQLATKNLKRRTIVVDYSHPNIAKPMSVAHMRSTIIGAALVNIFKFAGWKTIGDNHLGDWGKQFGVLIAAYKEKTISNKQLTIRNTTIEDLLKLYVDYTARMKADSVLEDVARLEVKKLQEGNRENIKIWKSFYKVSLEEFKKIYKIFGVTFDYYLGESFYQPELKNIVEDALGRGVAKRSEGAVIIPLDPLPPFVIQKSDEAFLYSTTDLAAIKYRVTKFKPEIILYVVDNGQSLHFEQLFASVEKLGYVGNEKLVHAKFGLILGEDMKKLSTRAGKHISLEGVIGEAIEKARAIVEEKRKDLTGKEKEKIARAIGIAALKYNDLSQNRQSDIAFRWEKMLNFEGNSAPYLMYTYARLKSILRKEKPKKFEPKFLESSADANLVLKLLQFPDVIRRVTETYFPHLLADYLYDLAKEANHFYHSEPVLKAEADVKNIRLHLVAAVAGVLKTGLGILGIDSPEQM
jgi:arginyl-tRNA synthetase